MMLEVSMPSLGDTVTSGRLVRWRVAEGEPVVKGDILAEVEADKATGEVEAPEDGHVSALIAQAGGEISIGAPILRLATATGGTPFRRLTVREALHEALAGEMTRDGDVFLIGRDIGSAGGAYRVTEGLIERFGEARVVDSPVTPAAMAGLAIGAAFAGLRPVVEFQSFASCLQALDQIVTSAAKAHYRTGGALRCPILFRAPNGSAARVGAQHAQDVGAWLAHIPGLAVVQPYSADDAAGLLRSAIRDDGPVVMLEHESLYAASTVFDRAPDDGTVPLGKARVRRAGSDISLIASGVAVGLALAAADALALEGVFAEVVDLRSLRPMDRTAIIRSVKKTGRCVTVEEGWPVCSIGSEIAALCQREAFSQLRAPVLSVTGQDVPLPYAEQLERLALPNVESVLKAVRNVLTQEKEGPAS